MSSLARPSPAGEERAEAPGERMPARRLTRLVQVLFLLESSLYAVVTPMLPRYAELTGASKADVGVLAAAYTAGLIPGALLGGWLAARAGVRRTTLFGLVVFAVSLTAFGFVTSLPWLDGLRAVQGAASGCIWGGALTWVIAATPVGRRGEVLGSVLAAAIFGTLIGPALGTLAVAVGTRGLFAGIAVLCLGLGVAVLASPEPPRPEPGPRLTARRVVTAPGLLFGLWLVMLDSMSIGAINTLIPLRMDHLGAPAVVIGLTFLVSSAVSTVASPLTGRLADRRGAVLPIVAGLAIASTLVVLLPLPRQVWLLAVLVVLAGGCGISVFGIPAAWVITTSAEQAGVAVAVGTTLLNVAFAAGETTGAPLAAGISQLSNDTVPLLGLATLMVVTLILCVLRRHSLPRTAPEVAADA